MLGKEVVLREGRESATPVVLLSKHFKSHQDFKYYLWAAEVVEEEEVREELEGKVLAVVVDKLKEVGIVDDREEEETVVEAKIFTSIGKFQFEAQITKQSR